MASMANTLLVRAGGGGPSSGTVEPPLSQAYGYGVVVGLGFAFALGMILCTWILKRYVALTGVAC
jgi:urea-proton symporter